MPETTFSLIVAYMSVVAVFSFNTWSLMLRAVNNIEIHQCIWGPTTGVVVILTFLRLFTAVKFHTGECQCRGLYNSCFWTLFGRANKNWFFYVTFHNSPRVHSSTYFLPPRSLDHRVTTYYSKWNGSLKKGDNFIKTGLWIEITLKNGSDEIGKFSDSIV